MVQISPFKLSMQPRLPRRDDFSIATVRYRQSAARAARGAAIDLDTCRLGAVVQLSN